MAHGERLMYEMICHMPCAVNLETKVFHYELTWT